MVELVGGLIALIALAFVLAPIWKYRHQILHWVKDPEYCDMRTWEQKREIKAERSLTKAQWKVQDCQDYLSYLKNKEAEKPETGGRLIPRLSVKRVLMKAGA